jgi:hypothetical protein
VVVVRGSGERLGHHAVLSNPKQTKAIAAARLKNDRVDAERSALLLRGDLLPTVWIPPARLREAHRPPQVTPFQIETVKGHVDRRG